MYEFTMGGAWFKWSALDSVSKRLAGISVGAAGIAALPIGIFLGEGLAHKGRVEWMSAQPWMAWVFLFGVAISAYCWWRFSLRQDEMFNLVQNWTLGMAGGWTIVGVIVWLTLHVAGAAPAPNVVAIPVAFYAAVFGFWFIAVRRWA